MTELELAKRDSIECISHLRNSLNAEAGFCLKAGKEGSDEDITIKSWHLHVIGTYLLRAQNLIECLKDQLVIIVTEAGGDLVPYLLELGADSVIIIHVGPQPTVGGIA